MKAKAEKRSIVVRQATEADLPAMLALLEQSNLPTIGVAESLEGFVVADRCTPGHSLIGVAGIERCSHAYGLLRSVAVTEEWQGNGLGRLLVDQVIATAKARGYSALYLLTTTAERYFPSFGFATISRDEVPDAVRATDEFRHACPASAAVMTRSLGD